MSSSQDEQARLARLTPDFSSEHGFNARLIDMRFRAMRDHLPAGGTCLELGSADGRMTRLLREHAGSLTAVDGSEEYCRVVAERFPDVEVVCALFEDYAPDRRFDAVVMGHVLEHVDRPVELLAHVRTTMVADGGRVLLSVPNANSLHRQAGVLMGMLETTTTLNEADHQIGHRRVYTREHLVSDVLAAGLRPVHVGGVFLKPVSNGQIDDHWPDELVEAYYLLGFSYPELCAELLVVAEG